MRWRPVSKGAAGAQERKGRWASVFGDECPTELRCELVHSATVKLMKNDVAIALACKTLDVKIYVTHCTSIPGNRASSQGSVAMKKRVKVQVSSGRNPDLYVLPGPALPSGSNFM